ncbi:hypothetical protein RchiOBHm_Chr1g0336211 [Rosa chinensis]|uniref:Uncharacterized protein n=1 Tax=Rosa chinensis TaxID=74649 RepID=A0A2P6SCN5_ROSCH|nr:hypothetical protein RchiOBHm_Chr1g0336211 [Rosa chinensis]
MAAAVFPFFSFSLCLHMTCNVTVWKGDMGLWGFAAFGNEFSCNFMSLLLTQVLA